MTFKASCVVVIFADIFLCEKICVFNLASCDESQGQTLLLICDRPFDGVVRDNIGPGGFCFDSHGFQIG